MNIAMWSGPRNLSTAMMYAFAARSDCAVWDEPFYAAYLVRTGLEHPMRDYIIAAGETDAENVARRCVAPAPDCTPVFFQKHMAQHMIEGMPRTWLRDVRNLFLIRHPARVVASFSQKFAAPTLEDLGFARQRMLFESLRDTGNTPIVIDSSDIRANPEEMLRKLCGALGLGFLPDMLSWPAGGHPSDGVWAPHWYGAVHASEGFAGPEGPLPELHGDKSDLAAAGLPHYETLAAFKL